jgi:hypothetical protein
MYGLWLVPWNGLTEESGIDIAQGSLEARDVLERAFDHFDALLPERQCRRRVDVASQGSDSGRIRQRTQRAQDSTALLAGGADDKDATGHARKRGVVYRKASMAAVVAPQEVPKRRVGVPSDDDAEMTSARCPAGRAPEGLGSSVT